MRPSERLDRLPEQYFTSLLARVAEVAAEPGEPLIDLGRGNPDVPPPAHVVEALVASAREQTPAVHGYAPFAGLPELREAIAARYAGVYGVELDPHREVAVLPGTKTALVEVALCTAARGDRIALPDPGYPDYNSAVALAGADRCRSRSTMPAGPSGTRWTASRRCSSTSTTRRIRQAPLHPTGCSRRRSHLRGGPAPSCCTTSRTAISSSTAERPRAS